MLTRIAIIGLIGVTAYLAYKAGRASVIEEDTPEDVEFWARMEREDNAYRWGRDAVKGAERE
jgi:hypothetical protein